MTVARPFGTPMPRPVALIAGVTGQDGATRRRFAAVRHGLEKVALRAGLGKAYAAFLTDAVGGAVICGDQGIFRAIVKEPPSASDGPRS